MIYKKFLFLISINSCLKKGISIISDIFLKTLLKKSKSGGKYINFILRNFKRLFKI